MIENIKINIFTKIDKKVFSCFIAAFVFITLCSKSSFLYPLNDWGDTNCFYTIAKGMLNQLVPYRDLIEQKGPFVFFIYIIAVLISGSSYFGVYILELFCAFLFLKISLSIIELYYVVDKYFIIIPPIIAGIVYSSSNFCHGGSVEEIFLFAFAYGVYLLLRYIEKNQIPCKREMFLWGILAGMIFYTKFSLCIMYVLSILFMTIKSVQRHEIQLLFKNALFFVLGCIITSVIVVIYFAVNNSLELMLESYFYNSTFKYLSSESNIRQLGRIVLFLLPVRNLLFLVGLILGIVWLCVKKKIYTFIFVICSLVSYFYLHFIVAVPRKYYGLPLCIYGLFGVCWLLEVLNKNNLKIDVVRSVIVFVFMIGISLIFTDNRYMLFKDKDSCVQTIFAKEMKSYGYDDYHMLYYGKLDEGFYQASQTLPNCPVFVSLNLNGDEFVDIQKDYVNNKKVEFIVTRSILCDSDNYEMALQQAKEEYGDSFYMRYVGAFDNFAYDLIDEMPYYYENDTTMMRLYKLRN